jgi:16S rRNA (cytidine1402-2'-O)-methyltransferase
MHKTGLIYIVATPIGHLGDMSSRAIETLCAVDLIAVEDTRHSQRLLRHFSIEKPLVALHDHNERDQALKLLERVKGGLTLALISDAGTPLISDPGYHLVHMAHEMGITVIPIPGPCALIAALSASGLPTDRFVFEGFLPVKTQARALRLKNLTAESRTLIFYEAPHRVLETLTEMVHQFGEERIAVLARELTKTYETIQKGNLLQLLDGVKAGTIPERGEIVLVVGGKPDIDKSHLTSEAMQILRILLEELSVKQAAQLTAKITGLSKRLLYDFALQEKALPDQNQIQHNSNE